MLKAGRETLVCMSSAIVIFDQFIWQCKPRIWSSLTCHNIYNAVVPGNCTDTLDISLDKVC